MTERSMTTADYARLQEELAELRVAHGVQAQSGFSDACANRLSGHSVRLLRIRDIQDRLTDVVVAGERLKSPEARPGMVVTIRHDGTDEVETFVLGRSQEAGKHLKAYSLVSPLGGTIVGARPGDQRIYPRPDQTHRVVTLLHTVPSGAYESTGTPS